MMLEEDSQVHTGKTRYVVSRYELKVRFRKGSGFLWRNILLAVSVTNAVVLGGH